MTSTDIVWLIDHPDQRGAERCRLARLPDGWLLTGLVVADLASGPIDVHYTVTTNDLWHTRSVDVLVDQLDRQTTLELRHHADEGWSIDGHPEPSLDGCDDVDLGITPATNTLPIRRLGLQLGEHADIDVAWVRFPHLQVVRSGQRYTHQAPRRWRYHAGATTADLTVDDHGLITRYGDNLWRRSRPAT